jgi:hypothetical protein
VIDQRPDLGFMRTDAVSDCHLVTSIRSNAEHVRSYRSKFTG